ncbi:acyl carrier protein [Streptomyces acidicola]|uniref:acyl carrier protein n=1 Tax=Streptomyces acidicola TaxID=2596892 RepID=UPI00341941F3
MQSETESMIEYAARTSLARVLESDIAPGDLDLDTDLADGYGLTSLNKVLFLMSACDEARVSLASFTEPDVAGMTTLRDVTEALTRHAGEVA